MLVLAPCDSVFRIPLHLFLQRLISRTQQYRRRFSNADFSLEDAIRLTPYKSDKLKYAEIMSFLASYALLVSAYKEGRFFMEKFKKVLGIYRPDIRKLALIGMLTALTAVIGMYCTLRIGTGIKISFKFISVFVLSSMFGPLWGGISCVISDILSYAVNPVAGFLPMITFSEFLYGFADGLFYYNKKISASKIIICSLVEIIFINIILTSYFLIPVMGLPYLDMIILRLPSALITLAIRIALLIPLNLTLSKAKIKR